MNEHPISAFVTNLGKYNEGELCGEWVKFPVDAISMRECFQRIGIDGIRYEEYFVTDYETNIDGLYDCLSEYVNLNELNYLATKIAELENEDSAKFESALANSGSYSLVELINLTENLDCYDYISDVSDDAELGYYWIEESGAYDLSAIGNLANYFDYEKFGRDIRIEQGGTFTENGYVACTGESFIKIYDGTELPDEYHIFHSPLPHKKEDPELER